MAKTCGTAAAPLTLPPPPPLRRLSSQATTSGGRGLPTGPRFARPEDRLLLGLGRRAEPWPKLGEEGRSGQPRHALEILRIEMAADVFAAHPCVFRVRSPAPVTAFLETLDPPALRLADIQFHHRISPPPGQGP